VKSEDCEATQRAAHTLKGSAGNFTEGRVFTLCSEIDAAARAGRVPEAHLVSALESELERLCASLRRVALEVV